ncbi:hypothetical protein NC653_000921, partial [Populus alba x Populus x berolinensis]
STDDLFTFYFCSYPNPLHYSQAHAIFKQTFVGPEDVVANKHYFLGIIQYTGGLGGARASPLAYRWDPLNGHNMRRSMDVYFKPAEVPACIVTRGGSCPGLNTGGYGGSYPRNTINFMPKVVNDIHKRGGTFLCTSRGGHDTNKIVDIIQDRRINQVIDKSFGIDTAVEEAQRATNACACGDPTYMIRALPSNASDNISCTHLAQSAVHGAMAGNADWKFGAEQFVRTLPDKVFVHCSEKNMFRLTLDGVDVMGERLAEEVLEVIQRKQNLRKISFVAHSVGGLVARYAIGRLYRPPKKENVADSTDDTNEDDIKATIGGLEPMNFITVATPHLGSRGNKQVPFLFGVTAFEKAARLLIHWIFKRTGRHLFLTDDDEGNAPLLKRMIEDYGDCFFMSALCIFKRRVAYSNVGYDHIVGWRTSSIRRNYELPKWEDNMNKEYPHIVYEERCKARDAEQSELISTEDDGLDKLEEELVAGLSRVSWEKVDVSFHASRQRFAAHSVIQVKDEMMHMEGADVIRHMIDHFLLSMVESPNEEMATGHALSEVNLCIRVFLLRQTFVGPEDVVANKHYFLGIIQYTGGLGGARASPLAYRWDPLNGHNMRRSMDGGYGGSYPRNTINFMPKVVNDIHKRGGTFLCTSRGGHDTNKIVDIIQDRRINQVIDKSFGIDTAVEEAQRATNAAHVEVESEGNGDGIVNLMGRYSGFIAMFATLSN